MDDLLIIYKLCDYQDLNAMWEFSLSCQEHI